MAKLSGCFKKFVQNISLTSNQVDDLIKGHRTLRNRLSEDETLSEIIVNTFLQGSYIRFTAIRPKGNSRSDVDVIVVTDLDKDTISPQAALELFKPFLEKYYPDKFRIQGRSIGIYLSYVDLDIVVTSAPSESEKNVINKLEDLSTLSPDYLIRELDSPVVKSIYQELDEGSSDWRDEPLYIPDREADEWKPTHPLEQISWTNEKNNNTNGHYRNVVKALKWWRKEKYPDSGHPKSYPLEHFIGDCCPDGIESIAEGVKLTLERMALHVVKPILPDRGVPDHDVFGRVTTEEYNEFHDQVYEASLLAKKAFESDDKEESIALWREIFGNKFPESCGENNNGYTGTGKQSISGGRFA